MVSKEVSMLQKGHSPSTNDGMGPPSKPSRKNAPQSPSTGLGSVKTPNSISGGRMGDNVTAEREGPFAQGVGQASQADEGSKDTSNMARAARTPHGAVEEPALGGANVLDASARDSASTTLRATRPVEEDGKQDEAKERNTGRDVWSQSDRRAAREHPVLLAPLGRPFQPRSVSREEYLYSGEGTATIAAKNFEGVIEDRVKAVVEPGRAGPRDPVHLQEKASQRQLARYDSVEQKNALLSKDEGASSLPETVRDFLLTSLVRGKYDPDGLLSGQEKYKQPVLNDIARMTMKNGTYLAEDGDRFLRKVRSLFPAAQPSKAQQKLPPKQ